MDLRGSNSFLRTIAGDIKTLSGAAAFTTVVLDEGKIVSISGDDLVSSFYLFKMPAAWLPYLAFERPVLWKDLGVEQEGETWLAAAVLPMGFASSVGVMQHIHRRLSSLELRKDREWPSLGDDALAWCLYLDDSTFLRNLEAKVAADLAGKPGKEQENLRKAYQFWGFLTITRKPSKSATRLKGSGRSLMA